MATERMKAGILHKLEQARGDSNPNQVTSRKKNQSDAPKQKKMQ